MDYLIEKTMHSFKFLSILLLFLIILHPDIFAGQFEIKATVKDYRNHPVHDVECVISMDDSILCVTSTNDNGELSDTINYDPTGVSHSEYRHETSDFLSGLTYNNHSNSGKICIYNILGQKVHEQSIGFGNHTLDINISFSSGKYIVKMETQNSLMISSVVFMDGQLIGVGKTKRLKQSNHKMNVLPKSMNCEFTLTLTKSGYEQKEVLFDPAITYNSFFETISLNQIPCFQDSMCDTLWPGYDLSYFIQNDDSGSWDVNQPSLDIVDGVLSNSDSSGYLPDTLRITYTDSVNHDIAASLDKHFVTLDQQKSALLLIAENLTISPGGEDELLFLMFHDVALELLSELFQVDKSELDSLSLDEIVDIYGEAWFIGEILNAAEPFYDKVVVLTDYTARFSNMMDSLKVLSTDGYVIDMIFSLHGSYDLIVLEESSYHISTITSKINTMDVNIRALYQTNCFGNSTIDDWEAIGLKATCGARGANSIAIFAPIYFLQNWTSGLNYEVSVALAYDQTIEKIKTYDVIVPLSQFWLTEESLQESIQEIGGSSARLFWIE